MARRLPYPFGILLLVWMNLLAGRAAAEEFIEVIVRPGDHLISICEEYLEDKSDWPEVARLNRLADPDRIFPAQKVIIPVRLLKGIPLDGKVTFVHGQASVKRRDTREWVPLQVNDLISEGAYVKTGAQSALEIGFDDGSSVFLRSNTQVRLEKARQKGAFYRLKRFFLQTGRVITRIKETPGQESRIEIDTPSAVCTPRGTEFRTSHDKQDTSRAEVLEGVLGVRAQRREVRVESGFGTVVEQGRKPRKQRKLLPPPAVLDLRPMYQVMPLNFRLGRVEGAVAYRVLLTSDSGLRNVVEEEIIKPARGWSINALADGTYYLGVRSVDDLGLEGPFSEPQKVTVRVNPLPPFIQTPRDGQTFRSKNISFNWLKVPDAEQYQIQIARDPAFTMIVAEQENIRQTSYTAEAPDFRRYYFRIRSVAADGHRGLWSDILSYEVIAPPPMPALSDPETDGDKIRIRWPAVGPKMTYHFQMAKDAEFNQILIDERTEVPELAFESPDRSGTYYVRTRAIDAEGFEGAYSNPQSFEVKKVSWQAVGGFLVWGIVLIIIVL